MSNVELYREMLNKEIEKRNGDLYHPGIIEISRELDKYIIKEMKENPCFNSGEEN